MASFPAMTSCPPTFSSNRASWRWWQRENKVARA